MEGGGPAEVRATIARTFRNPAAIRSPDSAESSSEVFRGGYMRRGAIKAIARAWRHRRGGGGSGPHRSWSGAVERPARPEHHASAARHARRVPRQRPRFAADRTDEAGAPEAARVGAQRLGARFAEDRTARRCGASSCRHGGECSCFRTGVELCRARLGELWRRLAARHERRRRSGAFHPGRQHVDRHLLEERRFPSRRVHVRLALVERAHRHRVRQRQPGRPDGRVRPRRRPLDRRRLRDGELQRAALLRVHRGLAHGRSRQRRLVLLRGPRRRLRASVVPRLPEDGHLAGRSLHDGQHVPGQHLPRGSRLGVQPLRPRVRRAASQRRRRHEHGELLQHAAEQHAHRGRRAAGRLAQLLRRGISVGLRVPGVEVPRRLLGQRLDVHRTDERQPGELQHVERQRSDAG